MFDQLLAALGYVPIGLMFGAAAGAFSMGAIVALIAVYWADVY